jgi:ABC-type uncharacterized transport system permease subunit
VESGFAWALFFAFLAAVFFCLCILSFFDSASWKWRADQLTAGNLVATACCGLVCLLFCWLAWCNRPGTVAGAKAASDGVQAATGREPSAKELPEPLPEARAEEEK